MGMKTAPSPVSACHRKPLSLETPPPPGASSASSRPLCGGGQWLEIGPMAVSGEGKQDLRGVSRLKPAEVMLSPDTVSMEYRPAGEGGQSPAPVSCISG